jgi:hypothetical protein
LVYFFATIILIVALAPIDFPRHTFITGSTAFPLTIPIFASKSTPEIMRDETELYAD